MAAHHFLAVCLNGKETALQQAIKKTIESMTPAERKNLATGTYQEIREANKQAA